jgi:hypothetical protein
MAIVYSIFAISQWAFFKGLGSAKRTPDEQGLKAIHFGN